MIFVTALYNVDGGSHDHETYLAALPALLCTGLPFWVFCEPEHRLQVVSRLPEAANVVVMGIPLDEWQVYRTVMQSAARLPAGANRTKDTLAYLALVNSKLEFAWRVAEMHPNEPMIAFIDAGIRKVISNMVLARQRLAATQALVHEKAWFAGIEQKTALAEPDCIDQVYWRFCGGYFMAHRDHLQQLHQQCLAVLRQLLLRQRITWEVNVWALAEQAGADFGWYPAGHNDRILAWPGAPAQQ